MTITEGQYIEPGNKVIVWYVNKTFDQNQHRILTLSRPLGHIWPTRIDLWTDLISPRGRRCSAGLHTADTLWHACIDFLTYSDDHPSWQSGLCPSAERSRSTTWENMRTYRSFPAVLKWLRLWKGWGLPSIIKQHRLCHRKYFKDFLENKILQWPLLDVA